MRKILFQGDSITDAGRTERAQENLGEGYPRILSEMFQEENAQVQLINRGVSGDRTRELMKRWDEDCIRMQPDVLSLLIGINDCWRKYDSNDETPTEEYRDRLEQLLKQVREHTNARIILMEPFVLPWPEDRKEWRVTLDPEIHVVRELAAKYRTGLIPLDGIMNQMAVRYGYQAISEDGVHPTRLGHQIIAEAWMREYKGMFPGTES